MKIRRLWLLPAVAFPYCVLIAVRLMRSGCFGMLYENAAPKVLGFSAAVWLAGFAFALAWAIASVRAGDPAKDMLRTMRTMKLAQIPAYLVYLQACFIFPFTIMTVPISVFYLPICLLAVIVIGAGLAGCVVRCRKEGAVSLGNAIGCFLGCFVPFCSLAICLLLYRQLRRRPTPASPSDTASTASE